ncbi:NSFL1 cofactor p47 isoform X2 [Oopsacas minuta]|uniref:NSFL1 cofactor p47 isoform X2 n=1 Tax=Oopsacas minuta TaxID=111878 RepID=A0AAV7K677_9METZ|nr:NSFL1 cofactor p47 isoform X2 [Oopsacas minuta]
MAVFGSPAEQDMLVDSFCGITGIQADRARNYLEAHVWNLETALSTYYDDNPGGHSPQVIQQLRSPVPKGADPKAGGYTNMKEMRMDQSKEMEKKKNEQFFAGGSDSSGQMIEGPPKPDLEDDIVTSTFKSAKEQGAESAEEYHRTAKNTDPGQFMGTGRRLGKSETEVSREIQGAPPPPKPKKFHLKFYKDGFTVDNGELRKFEDLGSKQFMMAISKGYIPDELVKEAGGQEVHLEMEDNREEIYTPSKPKLQPFGGSGQRLGSVAPEIKTNQPEPIPEVTTADTESNLPIINTSLPITTLQIRLADGTRLTQKFNHMHTIADLRLFISCKTTQTEKIFVIMTTFPNKELTDDSLTLYEANLLNAVVVQRFK